MDTKQVVKSIEDFRELLGNISVPVQKQLDDLRQAIDVAIARSSSTGTDGVEGDVTNVYNIRNVEENNIPTILTSAIVSEQVKKGQAVGQNTSTQRGYRWKATDPLTEYIGIAVDDADANDKVTCVYIGPYDFNNSALAASKSIYVDGNGTVTQNVTTATWARIGTGTGDGKANLIGGLGFTSMSASSIKIPDTDASDFLTITWDENDSADRALTLQVNGGDRNIMAEDDSIISQDYSVDGAVQFGKEFVYHDIPGTTASFNSAVVKTRVTGSGALVDGNGSTWSTLKVFTDIDSGGPIAGRQFYQLWILDDVDNGASTNAMLAFDHRGSAMDYGMYEIGAGDLEHYLKSKIHLDGDFDHDGTNFGVFGTTPTTQQAYTAVSDPPTQAEVTAIRDCLVNLGLMAGP